ncbi:3-alpha-(or 20-beta)-hydroxysteroid dehydrogenase (plasmid) [Lactiplantibacillus plantarum]|uniref:SDR family oxidoreductase n=1 Tax=Lactiplantibacillus plantarum TaxID=1590 RepID=UPI002AC96EC3|nr:SDR family oxidoreductase [Lactiplantibacillus plantarum]WPW67020.1 3-alpha-(or 20-beta)-hydroxysteroid dehydrogenase [Lactiplantibacillus plantarum]
MADRLKGKVAIISGGTCGIGLAIAKDYVKEGAKVVIGARYNDDECHDFLKENPNDATYMKLQVKDEDNWIKVVNDTVNKYGHLDIVVNDAGIGDKEGFGPTTIDKESKENWDEIIGVNLTGTFLGIKHGMAEMEKEGHGGSIINISSIEGFVGFSTAAAYNASKGGVRLMTKSAALDAGVLKNRVRVNSVHPGYVKTRILPKNIWDQITPTIPAGRIGEPKDIAGICVYLGSEESAYATGAEFVVDGGVIAQ